MMGFGLLVKPSSAECNMRCIYCFYRDRPTDPYLFRRGRRMSDQVLKEMIRQYMSMVDAASISWQGGEPLLMGLDFFEAAVRYEMRFGRAGQIVGNSVQTNAALIDKEWARFFKRYNFLVGISLDGPKEIHDRYRIFPSPNRSSFDEVMRAVRILREYEVEFNVLAVVNNLNVKKPELLYDFFVSEGFRFLQFIPCVERDPVSGEITPFSVRPEEYADFLCALFDKWYNNGEPIVSIRLFDAILAIHLKLEPGLCMLDERCGSYVVVEYNGDLYPCDFFVQEDMLLGNLLQTPLPRIVQTEKFNWFASIKARDYPECKVCRWNEICRNSCPRFRYVLGGFDRRSYLCESFRPFLKYSNKRFRILKEKILTSRRLPAYMAGM